MIDRESVHALGQVALTSEYFLQITLDKSGEVASSDPNIGPIPSLFEMKDKPIFFSDCFLSSDWLKFESQRLKAIKNSHQSFLVELNKINYPENDTIPTKWEFFFISEDFETCLGIGHPIQSSKPYEVGLGDFMDNPFGDREILDSLLEDKMIGFWEFDFNTKTDNMSQGLGHMLGYSEEELSQNKSISWQKHIYPDDFPGLMRDLKNHFRTTGNIPFKREFRISSKSNETVWVLGFGKTIRWSKSGLPVKVLGFLLDISDRKKQEIWMKEHHHFLQELAFEQSHSLRARVANILGILEILDSEPKNEESQKLINIIKEETKKLDISLKKSIRESVLQNKSIQGEKTF
ncbi:PAS domain-containing protein [Algoriphagus marinus]|uniref:PAS domain-containing protein n=1 Tax=Algoriphagus marinus TaxID=1925762 RepID=UPI00094BA3AE|nr:PAS domain-containing protein [Algoriphagus marinus]